MGELRPRARTRCCAPARKARFGPPWQTCRKEGDRYRLVSVKRWRPRPAPREGAPMSTQFSRTRIAVLSMTALVACAKNATDAPPANPAVAASRDATRSGRVVTVNASTMARIGAVDPRFVSYNVEMLEVTGGKFWKPYKDIAALPSAKDEKATSADVPAGMSADLYQYREPIDLANPRLRALAAALGPAYMRVSGTWANTTYFADTDTPPAVPPNGYGGVLTRKQWLGVVAFSLVADAQIVTSVPIGAGTRDANGVWTPAQTRRWFAFTQSIGGTIAATEFMNEPTLAAMGGAPATYDAPAFGRDFKVFRAFMRKERPDIKVLGPGSVGESTGAWGVASGGYAMGMKMLAANDLVAAGGADVDAFSYHHYGASSQRCAAMGHQTTAADALSEAWLKRTDETLAYYRKVREATMPGKHFWNTETADAACGGNPWGGQFLDTFRFLDQLGRLAKQEVDVAQYARCQRLRHARRRRLRPQAQLLGRAAVAPPDGHRSARIRRSRAARPACLRPLPTRQARRRGPPRAQHRLARAHHAESW